MIKVNVEINNKSWHKKIKNKKYYFNKKLKKISQIPKIFKNKNITFTILLTNSSQMKKLNKKFRNKNKTTDVLSFPINSIYKKTNYIGDIAISFEIMEKRSKLKDFKYEFDKMWIHGYLHLVGHDHKKLKDFKKMDKKENLILKYLNK